MTPLFQYEHYLNIEYESSFFTMDTTKLPALGFLPATFAYYQCDMKHNLVCGCCEPTQHFLCSRKQHNFMEMPHCLSVWYANELVLTV